MSVPSSYQVARPLGALLPTVSLLLRFLVTILQTFLLALSLFFSLLAVPLVVPELLQRLLRLGSSAMSSVADGLARPRRGVNVTHVAVQQLPEKKDEEQPVWNGRPGAMFPRKAV
ncbi:MAG: hypothetical protein EXR47_04555 [Dehalococcoidia bacterium]|nr:hypothetical protein [Dehalococcoidia bacterium]